MGKSFPIILALACSITACASHGVEIDDQKYQQMVEGKTTKSELIAVLGEPSGHGYEGTDEKLRYYFTEGDGKNYIPVVGAFIASKHKVQSCIFVLSSAGVLKHKECTEQSVTSGLGGD